MDFMEVVMVSEFCLLFSCLVLVLFLFLVRFFQMKQIMRMNVSVRLEKTDWKTTDVNHVLFHWGTPENFFRIVVLENPIPFFLIFIFLFFSRKKKFV